VKKVTFEKREINADRMCDGISRIGYRPHAAIADIIDNSIAAHASEIQIQVDIQDGSTLVEKNNIIKFTIIDNGIGMTDDEVKKALDLGSIVEYEDNSLSKYGLGLKSAGLSLGNKVSVISKKKNRISYLYSLDRDVIRKEGTYGVCVEEANEELSKKLSNSKSGTVVEVTKTHTPQDSANTVIKNLKERLGVIYYEFYKKKKNPLKIYINYTGKVDVIEPLDIMFLDAAKPGFDPDEYEGKSPRLVKDDKIVLYDVENNKLEVPVKMVIFPKAEMRKFVGFNKDEQSQIDSYRISRKNSGFFIYRNGRLIRWGDNLGIVSKDYFGFRGRIDITTEHDDLLHVDVSKQNLVMSEEFLDTLKLMSRIPLNQSSDAFQLCNIIKSGGVDLEGTTASETLENLTEEDPDTHINPVDSEQKKSRRKKAQEETKSSLAEDGEDKGEEDNFKKVRYSDKIGSTHLWCSESDPVYQTFVRVNKNHQFYNLILSKLPEGSEARVAIEALIFMLAVGENITKENLSTVDYEDIKRVFNKFKGAISYNMEQWSAHNQDLMD
jgi:hypothetical protein